jgi:hypothetical protein
MMHIRSLRQLSDRQLRDAGINLAEVRTKAACRPLHHLSEPDAGIGRALALVQRHGPELLVDGVHVEPVHAWQLEQELDVVAKPASSISPFFVIGVVVTPM